jgi:hypothetical protein
VTINLAANGIYKCIEGKKYPGIVGSYVIR